MDMKGSTKYQLLKDDFDHAIEQIKLRNEEIKLLRVSREASIHEYRQLSNERMKFKEEIEFLKDDVQIRDERIEELEKELHELKRAANKS
jgi:chromosome segregation ATPase